MLICVTNRHLCKGDFLAQLEQIAAARPAAILLRERDLSPASYHALVAAVAPLAAQYEVPLLTYLSEYYPPAVKDMGMVHLPYPQFARLLAATRLPDAFGVSVHNKEEARVASLHGARYLIAGHIFATDCKKGIPPRGLPFLRGIVTAATPSPVYAIGGISPQNMASVHQSGAAGGCVMSALMQSPHPADDVRAFL